MNVKRSEHKKLVGSMSAAIVVLSIVTVMLGITPLAAAPYQEATVTRDLPKYVTPNQYFTVTLTQSGFLLDTGIVWEVLPVGFTYVDGSYTGGWNGTFYDPVSRTLEAGFYDETVISYEVQASSADQMTATFSGAYRSLVLDPVSETGIVTGDLVVKVDGIPPYTANHYPAKGATGVPVTTNIVVHVKDNFEVDPSSIVMRVNGNPVSPSIVPRPESNDYKVTYDPSDDFDTNATVTVSIDASDAAGNAMPTDSYSFITAGWTPPPLEYDLTITSTDGGSVTTPGEGTFTYDAGEVVNLEATPDANYTFDSWTGDVGTVANVNDETTTITMNGDYAIVANFDEEGGEIERYDINEDCSVDFIDLAMLSAHWGETTTAPYPRYDINEDGTVDFIDLAILSAHWGESTC